MGPAAAEQLRAAAGHLDDIERLCPRLVVIDRGTMLADGSLDGLRHHLTFRRADITAAAPIAAVATRAEVHDLVVLEPEIDDVVRRLYARR